MASGYLFRLQRETVVLINGFCNLIRVLIMCLQCEASVLRTVLSDNTLNTLLSNIRTNIQFVDTIRIIIKYLKIFKNAPTYFGSQGIHHQGALYRA